MVVFSFFGGGAGGGCRVICFLCWSNIVEGVTCLCICCGEEERGEGLVWVWYNWSIEGLRARSS